MHNFKVVACDTDSVFFKKESEDKFSEEEAEELMKELNGLYPEHIKWELNGLFEKQITARAKNYILYDGKSIKIKGSALKASTKEAALKSFINEIIDSILHDKNNHQEIYHRYVKEILNVTDIKRWVSRKTISKAVLTSDRTNEVKVRQAIEGTDYREGDRCYMFFKPDESLCLVERFDGEYDKDVLLKKLYNTSEVFSTVLNNEELFLNFSLKRNKKKLEELT